MTIAEALGKADEAKETLQTIRMVGGYFTDSGIISIENTITALEEIIYWYDRNQRNLIKALVGRTKGANG